MTSKEFWAQDWASEGDPPFHEKGKNHLLVLHLDKLINGRKNIQIFFPMCGKLEDMKWMYDLGHTVVGVELIEKGIQQFFRDNGLTAEIEDVPAVNGKLYKTKDGRMKLYCCSIFDFTKDVAGEMDGIFDRGAYGILDKDLRPKYADAVVPLMARDCQYLLNTIEFEEDKLDDSKAGQREYHNYTLKEIMDTFSSRNCFIELLDLQAMTADGKVMDRLHLITRKS